MGKNIYTVIAGSDRPSFIETGVLEKGSGQTRVQAGVQGGKAINRPGDCGIPCISENWAVRKINGKIPDKPVDVKDTNYRGELEFLPWGDPKGMLVMTRYLKGYDTLDMLYQNLVLNAEANINVDDASSADAFFIILKTGVNEFDEDLDPYKTLFIKNGSYNQNSTSKNPQHISYQYFEKNEQREREALTQALDDKGDAIFLVKDCAKSLDRLRNLFGVVQDLVNSEIADDLLFDVLMNLADRRPSDFMERINGHKRVVSNMFDKAKAYGILDLTKDGTMVAGKDKKVILADEVPGKGQGMIDWVFNNLTEPKAASAVHQLKQLTDKLK